MDEINNRATCDENHQRCKGVLINKQSAQKDAIKTGHAEAAQDPCG